PARSIGSDTPYSDPRQAASQAPTNRLLNAGLATRPKGAKHLTPHATQPTTTVLSTTPTHSGTVPKPKQPAGSRTNAVVVRVLTFVLFAPVRQSLYPHIGVQPCSGCNAAQGAQEVAGTQSTGTWRLHAGDRTRRLRGFWCLPWFQRFRLSSSAAAGGQGGSGWAGRASVLP
ncbi:MAG: hypothetical protein RL215_2827, partial [Planctomycetota bacterium]